MRQLFSELTSPKLKCRYAPQKPPPDSTPPQQLGCIERATKSYADVALAFARASANGFRLCIKG